MSTRSRTEKHDARRSPTAPQPVDNTDWLKAGAIFLVGIDHFGYFFLENDLWWSALGRVAAPPFFFLLGYARTRTVPLHWILLGVILTLLEAWNADWAWVTPNIFFSFALIRAARPHVQSMLQHYGWMAFAIFVAALVGVLPLTANLVDYGSTGWLWALFGLCQRMYVDGASQRSEFFDRGMLQSAGFMRLLACFVTVGVYLWQEQSEHSFPEVQLAAVAIGIGALSASLCQFQRGPSPIQPPEAVAVFLRFIGRHTLELYAIQLAGSELVIKFVPALAP